MTDKKSRRVVIINNINSDTIDQAIFILKSDKRSDSVRAESNIVYEAQNIINNYIRRVEQMKGNISDTDFFCGKKKKHKTVAILSAVAAFLALAAVYAAVGAAMH